MFLAGIGSFGGGLGAVNILRDFALGWNWILFEDEFLRVTSIVQFGGYSQGMMMAGYLGSKEELGLGVFGSILGIAAFILPSIIIIAVLLKIGAKLYKHDIFRYSVKYTNLIAAGLLCVLLWNYMGVVFDLDPIVYIAVAGLAAYLNLYFGIKPLYIVLGGAAIGLIWRA
jgi:chromate transport protein ChrA